MTKDDVTGPPSEGGWQLIEGPFEALTGPMYWTSAYASTEEPVRVGFRVLPKHCNPNGFCHGGMIATFLDMALGMTSLKGSKVEGPTMSLTVDFLSGAAPGDWVESRSRFVHASYKTAYTDVVAVGPKGPVARGTGMFRLMRPK